MEIDKDGIEKFMNAAAMGDVTMVKMFIEAKVDVNIRPENRNRRTPLIEASREGRIDIVKVLLENGADPNIPDMDERTALMFVARYGFEPIATMLLDHGANPFARNNDGLSANDFAKAADHSSLLAIIPSNDAFRKELQRGAEAISRLRRGIRGQQGKVF